MFIQQQDLTKDIQTLYELHDEVLSEIQDEINTCRSDPVYFINNFVRVRGETITLNRNQIEWVEASAAGGVVRYGEDRQTGRTTVAVAFALWQALFQDKSVVMYIGANIGMARFARELYSDMFLSLPIWLQARPDINNRDYVQHANGNRTLFRSGHSPHAIRGYTLSVVVYDVVSCFAKDTKRELRNMIAAAEGSTHIVIG